MRNANPFRWRISYITNLLSKHRKGADVNTLIYSCYFRSELHEFFENKGFHRNNLIGFEPC